MNIQVKINKSNSHFFRDMEGSQLLVPINHGEGKMIFSEDLKIKKIISSSLTPMQFCTNEGFEADVQRAVKLAFVCDAEKNTGVFSYKTY